MTLGTSFNELNESVENLAQVMDNLLWAVIKAQPKDGLNHILVDQHEMSTSDLLEHVKALREAALAGLKAVSGPLDLPSARLFLVRCQAQFNELLRQFDTDFIARMIELNDLLRECDDSEESQKELLRWANGVYDGHLQCPTPIYNVSQALFHCWQDLTERMNIWSVSMQGNNVGQETYVFQPREQP